MPIPDRLDESDKSDAAVEHPVGCSYTPLCGGLRLILQWSQNSSDGALLLASIELHHLAKMDCHDPVGI